mmetsp:Transcript_1250/g.2478  ORF Transcript_1250/g.2478 Transcript_1250/m.2478 type:complete len:249 (+) Transcript_1250:1542-2288(+)
MSRSGIIPDNGIVIGHTRLAIPCQGSFPLIGNANGRNFGIDTRPTTTSPTTTSTSTTSTTTPLRMRRQDLLYRLYTGQRVLNEHNGIVFVPSLSWINLFVFHLGPSQQASRLCDEAHACRRCPLIQGHHQRSFPIGLPNVVVPIGFNLLMMILRSSRRIEGLLFGAHDASSSSSSTTTPTTTTTTTSSSLFRTALLVFLLTATLAVAVEEKGHWYWIRYLLFLARTEQSRSQSRPQSVVGIVGTAKWC